MLAGELYRGDDPLLLSERRRCQQLLREANAELDDDARFALLSDLLGSLGEGTVIMPPLRCDYGYNIAVGAHTFVNYGAVILDVAPVTIGERVQIATNVQLLTADHPLDPVARASGDELGRPIAVGAGAWLGGGAILCPGVSVGENSVIGAGSVVTRDIPASVVAVGNPCRVLRVL